MDNENPEEQMEMRNPFPSPPSFYTNYTTHNLKLLALLRDRSGVQDPLALASANQQEILSDQEDVPTWPLSSLEKPRVDWINEENEYTVFGRTFPITETLEPLESFGITQLYSKDPEVDRRPALLSLLRSWLLSYSNFIGAILLPPQGDNMDDWRRHMYWMDLMAKNIMAAANDYRPMQARENLEIMMKRQIEIRRAETQAMHQTCDEMEARLSQLRGIVPNLAETKHQASTSTKEQDHKNTFQLVPDNDVLQWAEKIN